MGRNRKRQPTEIDCRFGKRIRLRVVAERAELRMSLAEVELFEVLFLQFAASRDRVVQLLVGAAPVVFAIFDQADIPLLALLIPADTFDTGAVVRPDTAMNADLLGGADAQVALPVVEEVMVQIGDSRAFRRAHQVARERHQLAFCLVIGLHTETLQVPVQILHVLHVFRVDQRPASDLLLAITEDDFGYAIFAYDDVIRIVLGPGQDLAVVSQLTAVLIAMRFAHDRAVTSRHGTDDAAVEPLLAIGLGAGLVDILILQVVLMLARFAL